MMSPQNNVAHREPFGGLDARLAAGRAWEARRRVLRARAARYEVADDDRRLDRVARCAARLAGTVLERFGWGRHQRGGWRKRKEAPVGRVEESPAVAALRDVELRRDIRAAFGPGGSAADGQFRRDHLDDLRAKARANLDRLIANARTSQVAAARILREAEWTSSAREMTVAYCGDPLEERLEESILARLEPTDQLRREVLRRRLAQVRAKLAGPKPSAVEGHLVARAGTCWLALLECELAVLGPDAHPTEEAQRRLDHANRRFLDVMKALDSVRRRVPAHHLAMVRLVDELPALPAADPPPPAIDVTPEPR